MGVRAQPASLTGRESAGSEEPAAAVPFIRCTLPHLGVPS